MAHEIDLYVGQKIRERRVRLGLSQDFVATELGVTFQQLQKYENATNRVSCSRLWELARILRADVPYFFPLHGPVR